MKTWKELTTAERIDEIRRAHPQTIGTASRIAVFLSDKFGEPISRNVVMGLYDRNRSEFTDMPLSNDGRAMTQTRKAEKAKRLKLAPVTEEVQNPPAPVDAEPADLPALPSGPRPLLLKLFELGNHDCRWPVGGEKADTLFCGHPQARGSSYCDCHKRMSFGRGTESERSAHRVLKAVA